MNLVVELAHQVLGVRGTGCGDVLVPDTSGAALLRLLKTEVRELDHVRRLLIVQAESA